jgi:hypothetical protein
MKEIIRYKLFGHPIMLENDKDVPEDELLSDLTTLGKARKIQKEFENNEDCNYRVWAMKYILDFETLKIKRIETPTELEKES